uniref:Uncharacterized protein n=1 Tax=Solanum tuberosum TaxID=4113 RepID=M1E077_SOLTU
MDHGDGREFEAVAREFGGQTFMAKARPHPSSRSVVRTTTRGPSREGVRGRELAWGRFFFLVTSIIMGRGLHHDPSRVLWRIPWSRLSS